jgi:amphiphysin
MKNTIDYTVERMRGKFTRDWHMSSYADEIVTGHGSMTKETQSIVLEAEYENATNFSVGATTDNLPPGVLYRVKATYKYNREDVDELSFDVGEIIRVVEYDDPEEQVCDRTE